MKLVITGMSLVALLVMAIFQTSAVKQDPCAELKLRLETAEAKAESAGLRSEVIILRNEVSAVQVESLKLKVSRLQDEVSSSKKSYSELLKERNYLAKKIDKNNRSWNCKFLRLGCIKK